MTQILAAQDIRFAWGGSREPWLDVDRLEIETGKLYGLLGRNGAGKTTLIKLLCGGLRPHAGRVELSADGRVFDVADRRPESLREVVFVTESCDLPSIHAEKFGSLAGPFYPRFEMATFLGHLNALDVPTRVVMTQLSFGQRRKVQIAFALATRASLTFLDEPTNGLDVVAQVTLRKLLIEHISDDRSLVVSTHHVREFETVIDEALVLERGRMLAREAVEVLRDTSGFDGLETWYMQLIGAETARTAGRAQHDLV